MLRLLLPIIMLGDSTFFFYHYISFLGHKVQQQAPASLNFLNKLPKGLPSFPISSVYAKRHLCVNPLSVRGTSSPGFLNLLSILLSYVKALHGHLCCTGLGWSTFFQDPPHSTSDGLIMLVWERESCVPIISLANKFQNLKVMFTAITLTKSAQQSVVSLSLGYNLKM